MANSSERKCPRCGQESQDRGNPFRPFCSERCKMVDLGNWVSGTYRITAGEARDDQSLPPQGGKGGVES